MTKVENLTSSNPYLNISLIDVIKLIDPSGKSKYVELIHKLGPKKRMPRDRESSEGREVLIQSYNINRNSLSKYTNAECSIIYFFIDRFFSSSDIKMLNKLHSLSLNNLVENFDLSKINSYEDVSNFITLAEIKKTDKDLEKMTKVLLNNDNWLVIRPLSHKSSLKYGAATKWCTAAEKDPHYFMKYIKRGILIYIINTKTGNKTAFFHATDYDDIETSFWDVIDNRVDSIETDLTKEVLDIIKEEMKLKIPNYNLLTEEQKKILEIELYSNDINKVMSVDMTISSSPEMGLDSDTNEHQGAPVHYISETVTRNPAVLSDIPTMRG